MFKYDADDNVDTLKTEQNFVEFVYNVRQSDDLAKDLIEFADKDSNQQLDALELKMFFFYQVANLKVTA